MTKTTRAYLIVAALIAAMIVASGCGKTPPNQRARCSCRQYRAAGLLLPACGRKPGKRHAACPPGANPHTYELTPDQMRSERGFGAGAQWDHLSIGRQSRGIRRQPRLT